MHSTDPGVGPTSSGKVVTLMVASMLPPDAEFLPSGDKRITSAKLSFQTLAAVFGSAYIVRRTRRTKNSFS